MLVQFVSATDEATEFMWEVAVTGSALARDRTEVRGQAFGQKLINTEPLDPFEMIFARFFELNMAHLGKIPHAIGKRIGHQDPIGIGRVFQPVKNGYGRAEEIPTARGRASPVWMAVLSRGPPVEPKVALRRSSWIRRAASTAPEGWLKAASPVCLKV
ncbi:MAG: hypothetical protein GDA40_05505 [Rhodobacteraceae bacterium]|nr:hypothetical protein [Paracoccaceae bacterium]